MTETLRKPLQRDAVRKKNGKNGDTNKLSLEDRPAHDWYRFVLSYPPHLVRDYLHRFGVDSKQTTLDPFCGTATTVVECKRLGLPSVGIEAHPMAHFAGCVKTDWMPDPRAMVEHATIIADECRSVLEKEGIADDVDCSKTVKKQNLLTLPDESTDLLLTDSISPIPLHKVLVLLQAMRQRSGSEFHRHQLLALAKGLVTTIGNLHFGPEVGISPAKPDAPVVSAWLNNVKQIAADLEHLRTLGTVRTSVIHADSRQVVNVLPAKSIDVIITSPPYPNEKDYTRTTRLESVLLGLVKNKVEMKALKQHLMRSNTRNVYKGDDDDKWIANHAEVQRIAAEIEAKRIAMKKTSGFEKLYHRVTRLYFGGMARHFNDLKTILKPGARLAYVVGDQASYLQVMIRTGELLADIAKSQGYKVIGIDLFRTRLATATKQQLREEVVLLEWPGPTRGKKS